MAKISIGTDIVSITRFSHWYLFSREKLSRIFSDEEIDYCLKIPGQSAEKFAVRFATRESLYKAISQHDSEYKIPFLTLCSSIIISKQQSGTPIIKIKENSSLYFYLEKNNFPKISFSISHEKNYAIASLLLYSND